MMQPLSRQSGSLHDAFYELSLAQPMPDPETLDALIRVYPEHAEALTAFAIDLTVDALANGEADAFAVEEIDSVSPAVASAMSAYHNRMYELQKGKKTVPAIDQAASEAIENPFLKLDRAGIRALAASINANPTFVSKLRDRIIDAGTFTSGFLQMIAEKLGESVELVTAHLSAPDVVRPAGQFYKADQKPVLGTKQSFSEAVRTSGLTEEQQRHLLSL